MISCNQYVSIYPAEYNEIHKLIKIFLSSKFQLGK